VKLIVGLGNPGAKYRGTRHNIGFAVVDELADRRSARFDAAPVAALVARARLADSAVVLLGKPLTFMNASGEAVAALARYFRIDIGDLLVVADDVNLALGRLRVRPRGSDGGHKGFKSIGAYLGTGFPRLRVGVGRGDTRRDLADHVLARFDSDERPDVEQVTKRAADAAELFVTAGIDAAMNRFNAADDGVSEEEAR
jgi:PTH1 family peptidyl-tRNA hydrolase